LIAGEQSDLMTAITDHENSLQRR